MGNKKQLTSSLIEYLLDNHKAETLDVLREERLLPKFMNEYQILAATMEHANIYATH